MKSTKPEITNVLLQLTLHRLITDIKYQVESGNPGESKELRNAREKFNRVFGVSLGEEDRLVIFTIWTFETHI